MSLDEWYIHEAIKFTCCFHWYVPHSSTYSLSSFRIFFSCFKYFLNIYFHHQISFFISVPLSLLLSPAHQSFTAQHLTTPHLMMLIYSLSIQYFLFSTTSVCNLWLNLHHVCQVQHLLFFPSIHSILSFYSIILFISYYIDSSRGLLCPYLTCGSHAHCTTTGQPCQCDSGYYGVDPTCIGT